MNWVDVESKNKKINWVGIDGGFQKTMNWTTLYNETNSENNHKLGDKFEKFVTGYLNQLDAENRPTQSQFIKPKTNLIRHAVSCGNTIVEKFGKIKEAIHVGRESNTESGDIHIILANGQKLILEMKYIGHSAAGSWQNGGAEFLSCVDSTGKYNFMTVIEAFDINPAKTYSIKEYRSGVSNVNLFTDIPGVKFSTKTLSFFGSLCAIVEPLQKMKIVNKTPKKQITPFKVGASTLTDSPQNLVLYKDGKSVFVKHDGKDDGVELSNPRNWVFDDGVSEMQIAPASIYTLLMQLGIDFCKTLKDDHFAKLSEHEEFLPALYDAIYNKMMTSGERTGHKKTTPNFIVKFIRRGSSGNTIIQSEKEYRGKEEEPPRLLNSNGKARFYLCKGNIKFPIQYRWRGGAMMDNLSFHVEMPLDIDQKDTRGENGEE